MTKSQELVYSHLPGFTSEISEKIDYTPAVVQKILNNLVASGDAVEMPTSSEISSRYFRKRFKNIEEGIIKVPSYNRGTTTYLRYDRDAGVATCEEISINEGPSVTNAAEFIYKHLRELHGPLIYFEIDSSQNIDRFSVDEKGVPSWRRAESHEIDQLRELGLLP